MGKGDPFGWRTKGSPFPKPLPQTPSPPQTRFVQEDGSYGQTKVRPSFTVPRHTQKTEKSVCLKTGRIQHVPVVWPKTRDTRALPSTPYLPFRARILSRFRGNKSGFRRERLSAQRPQHIRPSGQYPAVRHTYLPGHSASGKAVPKATSPLRLHHAHRGTDSDGCPPHHASLSKKHMSVFWEMGEFEGEGPFFPPEKGPFPLKSISPLP